ncbi:hypothetical protein SAMN05443582_101598 [Phyllobacterium sp. OV277]|nr:hypothetical protein SAMN05443582_101598 [Phyllobacterium sp. OV277]
MVAKIARHAVLRNDAETHFVRDQNNRTLKFRQRFDKLPRLGGDVALIHHQIGKPERQAIDKNRLTLASHPLQSIQQIKRLFYGAPQWTALLFMQVNAYRHFLIPRPARCDIDRIKARRLDQAFGKAGFARAGTAEDESHTGIELRHRRYCNRNDPSIKGNAGGKTSECVIRAAITTSVLGLKRHYPSILGQDYP